MTRLWHMRLGHMSERGMQILSKADLLGGHKVTDLDFCEHCVFRKLHRSKFPKGLKAFTELKALLIIFTRIVGALHVWNRWEVIDILCRSLMIFQEKLG